MVSGSSGSIEIGCSEILRSTESEVDLTEHAVYGEPGTDFVLRNDLGIAAVMTQADLGPKRI